MKVNQMWPKIAKEDIIEFTSWEKIADHVYEGGELPPDGVVYTRCSFNLYEFFMRCREQPEKKYILVTGNDDFGPKYQEDNPVYDDFFKFVRLDNFVEQVKQSGHRDILVKPRCDVEKCDEYDKFSIKSYSYTKFTFNKLPKPIKKWFTCNSGVDEGDIVCIPLGIQDGESEIISKINPMEREALLYINFSLYNFQREAIQNYFRIKNCDWVTLYDDYKELGDGTAETPRTHEEFLNDLASHDFTFAPEGNGLDTYRLWQSIYTGSIPIYFANEVNHVAYAKSFQGLPVLYCADLTEINEERLRFVLDDVSKGNVEFRVEKAKLSYWKGRIAKAAEKHLNG